MYWCPEVCIYTHKNLPESKTYIWIIQNVHEKSGLFYISITRQSSLVQPDTWLSPPCFSSAASHQCFWDIAAASRHNRFGETHSHLQLSYHITDRLLAAGNEYNIQVAQKMLLSPDPWKKMWFFTSTYLNPLHPQMLCVTFGWNWPSGSGEEDVLNVYNLFSLFGFRMHCKIVFDFALRHDLALLQVNRLLA